MPATAQFSVRQHWRELKRGRPGRRFQDRYESRRRRHQNCGAAQRVVLTVAAAIAFVIGLVLSVIPGPAIPFFFLAGGLLATESRTIARLMDWIEVKLRVVIAWGKRRWRRLPTFGRVIMLVMLAGGSATAAYVGYSFLSG